MRASSWSALAAIVASISANAFVAERALLHLPSIVAIVAGTVCLFSVIIWTVWVYRQSDFSVGPRRDEFYDLISDKTYLTERVHALVGDFLATESANSNERLLKRKAFFMTLAIVSFAIEFACYGVAAAIPFVHFR